MKCHEVQIIEHESKILRGNPLGDPLRRKIHIYLPPGEIKEKVPAVLCPVGFTGTGSMLLNEDPLDGNLKEMLDELILSEKCPRAIFVLPDCYTKLGGNQYINSLGTGDYEDYIIQEIIPFVSSIYKISNWGAFGSSSGGYGAFSLAMRNPDVIQAIACHSLDANFEIIYTPEIIKSLDTFKNSGGIESWMEEYFKAPNKRNPKYRSARYSIAMAAHYSPNLNSKLGFDFPYCEETGDIKTDIWKKWKSYDPLNLVSKYKENLLKQKYIFIDCGNQDELKHYWGVKSLSLKLNKYSIPHIYEEYNGGHYDLKWRYRVSLPCLVSALID